MTRLDSLLYLPPPQYEDLAVLVQDVSVKIASASPNLQPDTTKYIIEIGKKHIKDSLGAIGLRLEAVFNRTPFSTEQTLGPVTIITNEQDKGVSKFVFDSTNEREPWTEQRSKRLVGSLSTDDMIARVACRIQGSSAISHLLDSVKPTTPEDFIRRIVIDPPKGSSCWQRATYHVPMDPHSTSERHITFSQQTNSRLLLAIGALYNTSLGDVYQTYSFIDRPKESSEARLTLTSETLTTSQLAKLYDPKNPNTLDYLKIAHKGFSEYIDFASLMLRAM